MERYGDFFDAYDAQMLARAHLPLEALGLKRLLSCLQDKETARVYLAEDMDGHRLVVKCASEERRARLRNEYEMLTRLDHPAFPQAIRLADIGEWTYLLRAYVSGRSLAEYAQARALTPTEAIALAREACAAVMHLHAQTPAVIHRDIKPENFILTEQGSLMLIDLDTTHLHDPNKASDTTLLGTVAVAAPEQYGVRRSDARTDVYALGKLLIYLLTNSYDAASLTDFALPRGLRRVIRRSTSFDPDRRYASVAQMERALARIPHGGAQRLWRRGAAVCLAVICAAVGLRLWAAPAGDDPHIANPMIAEAAALQAGKPVDALTHDDLKAITALYVCGSVALDTLETFAYYSPDSIALWHVDVDPVALQQPGVDTLEDLPLFPNLQHLALYQQAFTDLTPLDGMQLESLALGGAPVEDFSVVARMDSLQALDICYTGAQDATVLSALPALRSLCAVGTGITDLTPIADAPVESLRIDPGNIAENPDILLEFPNLTTLNLSFVTPRELEILPQLVELTALDITAYPYEDLSLLAPLTHLRYLGIANGSLTTLAGIEQFALLEEFFCSYNSIADLTPLTLLPRLRMLGIANNPIADYTPLNRMPALESLQMDPQQEAERAIPSTL